MLGCAGTPLPVASAPALSPNPAARCGGTGNLGASTCGVSCAILIAPRFRFNWSADSVGSITDGCAITGICVVDFSFDTSAVGSTTCGTNCGILSCDNWRDDAAIG